MSAAAARDSRNNDRGGGASAAPPPSPRAIERAAGLLAATDAFQPPVRSETMQRYFEQWQALPVDERGEFDRWARKQLSQRSKERAEKTPQPGIGDALGAVGGAIWSVTPMARLYSQFTTPLDEQIAQARDDAAAFVGGVNNLGKLGVWAGKKAFDYSPVTQGVAYLSGETKDSADDAFASAARWLNANDEKIHRWKSPEQQAAERATAEAEGFVDTYAAYATHPRALRNLAIQQVPQLLLGGVVGKGLSGLAAAEAGLPLLGRVITAEAGMNAAMNSADAATAAQAEAWAQGRSNAEANKAGDIAALAALPASIASSIVGGKLGRRVFSSLLDDGMEKLGLRQLAARAGAKAITEGTKGAVEEGGGQWAQNVGARFSYDPQRPLLHGVANAAATGSMMGGVQGGAGSLQHSRHPANHMAAEVPPPDTAPVHAPATPGGEAGPAPAGVESGTHQQAPGGDGEAAVGYANGPAAQRQPRQLYPAPDEAVAGIAPNATTPLQADTRQAGSRPALPTGETALPAPAPAPADLQADAQAQPLGAAQPAAIHSHLPPAQPGDVLNEQQQPYSRPEIAALGARIKRLQHTHELVPVADGWALRPRDAAGQPAPIQPGDLLNAQQQPFSRPGIAEFVARMQGLGDSHSVVPVADGGWVIRANEDAGHTIKAYPPIRSGDVLNAQQQPYSRAGLAAYAAQINGLSDSHSVVPVADGRWVIRPDAPDSAGAPGGVDAARVLPGETASAAMTPRQVPDTPVSAHPLLAEGIPGMDAASAGEATLPAESAPPPVESHADGTPAAMADAGTAPGLEQVESSEPPALSAQASRVAALRAKWAHLSMEERSGLIQAAAEANASRWVKNLQDTLNRKFPGLKAHFWDKHAPDIPLPNMKARAEVGTHPREGLPGWDSSQSGASYRTKSTQFTDFKTMMHVLNEATTRKTRGLPLYNVATKKSVTGTADTSIGRGYLKKQQGESEAVFKPEYTDWIVNFDPNFDVPYTAFPMSP